MEQSLTIRTEEISALLDEAYKLRVNNIQKSISLAEKAHALGKELENQQLIGDATQRNTGSVGSQEPGAPQNTGDKIEKTTESEV